MALFCILGAGRGHVGRANMLEGKQGGGIEQRQTRGIPITTAGVPLTYRRGAQTPRQPAKTNSVFSSSTKSHRFRFYCRVDYCNLIKLLMNKAIKYY